MRYDFHTTPGPPYMPGGESALCAFAGELYGSSPFLLPPFLWWATGVPLVGLFLFTAFAGLFPYPLWRLARRLARALRWLVCDRPRPVIVWIE